MLVPLGLGLQIIAVVFPSFDHLALFTAAAWVYIPPVLTRQCLRFQAIATLIVVIDRPATAPISLLAIIISVLAAQLIPLIQRRSDLLSRDVPAIIEVILAVITTAIILCMPLRHLELPNQNIGRAYETPNHQLLSPEDNLTLCQFMTVSWMSPLISVGSVRQLNDEDVWSLPLEFHHRGLHDKFRELKGSVMRRLLAANGVDVIFIALLGVLETISSMKLRDYQLRQDKH